MFLIPGEVKIQPGGAMLMKYKKSPGSVEVHSGAAPAQPTAASASTSQTSNPTCHGGSGSKIGEAWGSCIG